MWILPIFYLFAVVLLLDLDKIIQGRTEQTGIGFSAQVKNEEKSVVYTELMRQVQPEDLIKFGLIPEFIGRLPVVAVLDELDEEALVRILSEPKNALTKQYAKLFELEGVEINFREKALREIALQALKRKSGARGLRSIVENTLLDLMYELPSIPGLRKVVIDENVVKGEANPLYIYENDQKESAA